ncbi:alpha/beta fold hydrolase [Chitinibacteraceae bacterium HSL-7]
MARWILLRGLGRDARYWEGFLPALASLHPQDRIDAPDLPGTGLRLDDESPARLPGITDAIRQQIAAEDKVHLVGLSLGGMVALDWAARFPAEVASLHLVNVSDRSAWPWQRLRPGTWPGCALATLAGGPLREQLIAHMTCRQVSRSDLDRRIDWQRQCRVPARTVLRQLAAAVRYRTRRPSAPCFLYASRGDRLVDPACSEHLAQRWQAPLTIHATAGHDLPHDEPEWLARCISDHVATIQP